MGVELRPLGVNCNIRCHYCYQNPQRTAGNLSTHYDLEKMKRAVEAESGGKGFTLFGGEPLLIPKPDLEDLFSWGFAKFGSSGIQTNGTLLDDDHVAMFEKYKVRVGLSIDGPMALNRFRWADSKAGTDEATQRSLAALHKLLSRSISVGLIVTLHSANGRGENLDILCNWLLQMQDKGLKSLRIHALEVESESLRNALALTPQETIVAFNRLIDFAGKHLPRVRLDIASETKELLLMSDQKASCVWRACDPYTTPAVRGIEGFGQRSNCGRTNKDGIDFVKSGAPGYERYLSLYATPQAHGGCRECRFFLVCKGQCPGTAVSGDWRNRTEHCALWFSVFSLQEKEILKAGQTPVSLSNERPEIEALLLSYWEKKQNPPLHWIASRHKIKLTLDDKLAKETTTGVCSNTD